MKTNIYSLFLAWSLVNLASVSALSQETPPKIKTYSVNRPASLSNSTLELTYDGTTIIAKRMTNPYNRLDPDDQVFLEANVTIDRQGVISVTDAMEKDGSVWFIPFGAGIKPVELNSSTCLKLACFHKKMKGKEGKWEFNSNCIRCVDTKDVVHNEVYSILITIMDCSLNCPKVYSGGGVIVYAHEVKIIEPSWYDPEKHGPIIICNVGFPPDKD